MSTASTTTAPPPPVALDLQATQKYVLLRLTPPSGPPALYIRGLAAAEYHDDILQHFRPGLLAASPPHATLKCLGGGRITFSPPSTYRVHGYSVAYGKANHELAASALQAHLPAGTTVTHDDEGY